MFDFIEDEGIRSKVEEAHKAQIKDLTEGLDKKIEEAVSGLKAKNEELLGEKKSIQERLAQFKDITDPEKALEALTFIQENEDAQLIKDGKIDELLEKRTSQMRIDHQTALDTLQEQLDAATNEGSVYKLQYEQKMIGDQLQDAAIKAGVRPEAIPDVMLRGRELYSLATDNTIEARDAKGNLVKNEDGNVLTTSVWLEGLKKTSPHYWPSSEGSGASGGSGGSGGDISARLAAAAKSNDMVAYRRLREKQLGKA